MDGCNPSQRVCDLDSIVRGVSPDWELSLTFLIANLINLGDIFTLTDSKIKRNSSWLSVTSL